jgi:hypothetical protein
MSNTQETIILNHLKEHKYITQWEAIQKYRITRLSARIYELREKGHNIITNHITENGKTFAEYNLINTALLREKD